MGILGVITDWLHLLTTTVWIGGMAFNICVLRPSLASIQDPAERVKLSGAVLGRFIYLAWGCIAILVITGIFMTRLQGDTTYGLVLLAKHTAILVMVLIVAVISFFLFPRSKRLADAIPSGSQEPGPLSRSKAGSELGKVLGQIVLLVKLNLTIGIVVLFLTASLDAV